MPTFSSHDCPGPEAGAALRHLAEAVVLGSLLALAWRACRAKHGHRHSGRSARAPAAVHTWEGEGGRPLPTEP